MKIDLIRRMLGSALAAAALLPAAAQAQDSKPLEWVVGYAAGGGSDPVARTVAGLLPSPGSLAVNLQQTPREGQHSAAVALLGELMTEALQGWVEM